MHSYDLESGDEIWTLRHPSYNAGIRPLWLQDEGLVLINTGGRGSHFIAVKLDDSTQGDITKSHVAWDLKSSNPRFSMPIYSDGLVFQTNDLGVVACFDATSGKDIWKGRLRGNYRGSPILAGEHLYFFNEEGIGTILKAGRTFEEVASNQIPEMGTTACPAVSDGAIFVRGKTHLYKIKQ